MSNLIALPIRPPEASELESTILGALLDVDDPLALFEACGLGAADFTNVRARIVWQVTLSLARRRRVVSAMTVFSAAKAANLLGEQDLPWLMGLQASNSLSRTAFAQVAEDLRMLVRSRQIAAELEQTTHQLRHGAFSAARLMAQFEALRTGLERDFAPDENASGDLGDLMSEMDARERENNKSLLVPTGIQKLDEVIGGWFPNLNLLIGQPGSGKNTVLGSVIEAQLLANQTMKLGLFGMEDGSAWLSRRLLARELGISLRDLMMKPRTVEQKVKMAEIGAAYYPVLERLMTYRKDSIAGVELIRRATKMIHEGCACIYIDNLQEIDLRIQGSRFQPQGHELVSEFSRQLRNCATRHKVPIVLLAHTNREAADKEQRPPQPREVMGSAGLERRARLMLGLWFKGEALRCTQLKANELAPGPTVEFERLFDSALVSADGGTLVNLQAEKRKEKQAADEQAEERRETRMAATRERAKKLKAQEMAEKVKAVEAAGKPAELPAQAAMNLESPKEQQ